MEENGRDFDIVKIRKTGSKTGQNQFRIFLSTFLNSLGQDVSNSTPFYAVGSILTSNLDLDLDLDLRPQNPENFFLQQNHFEVIKCLAAYLKCPKNIVSN